MRAKRARWSGATRGRARSARGGAERPEGTRGARAERARRSGAIQGRALSARGGAKRPEGAREARAAERSDPKARAKRVQSARGRAERPEGVGAKRAPRSGSTRGRARNASWGARAVVRRYPQGFVLEARAGAWAPEVCVSAGCVHFTSQIRSPRGSSAAPRAKTLPTPLLAAPDQGRQHLYSGPKAPLSLGRAAGRRALKDGPFQRARRGLVGRAGSDWAP